MIKKALEYIVNLNKPETLEINGEFYSDRNLERVSFNPLARPLEMSTLTSLIEYIKAGVDYMDEKMVVHVVSPLEVRLISRLDYERLREQMVVVKGKIPDYDYGFYIDHESFLIALQSKFIKNDDRELLLKFAGTVENGTVAKYGDDGVSQKATIKKGIASKEECLVPNPVKLRPFRTFIEVEQPESQFIFRMKDNERGGVQCAIFEADGGAWKNNAMNAIKDYLAKELAEYKQQFTVIS